MIEHVERVARTALWIALTLATVAVPVGMARSQFAEAEARAKLAEDKTVAELKNARDKIAELSKPRDPDLFPMSYVGTYLGWLVNGTSEGFMLFTNTSARTGVLCLKGVATNTKTGAISESIPACREIKPFDSNVRLDFKFAGGDLHKTCPQDGDCRFSTTHIDRQ
jgi:hypothetical protein